jgi:sortase A
MNARPVLQSASLLLLGTGCLLFGRHGFLRAKAVVAEHLVARAFHAHLEDGRAHRPWEWADMTPIARLEVDRLKLARYVLSGASGTSMAFGLGHIDGTAEPNADGNAVLAGHRDTWMAFLEELHRGDSVRVVTSTGAEEYALSGTRIVHETDLSVLEPSSHRRLTLVTCYPFDGMTRSPWRYIATFLPAGTTAPPGPRCDLRKSL